MNERTGISRAVFVVVGLLLFSGAALLLAMFLLPPVYFAKVTMEVKPEQRDDIFGPYFRMADSPATEFVPKQFEIMRGKEILDEVIENLVLETAWAKSERPLSKQQTLARLENSLEFRVLGNQSLVEIGVYASDPQDAANIANTIAVVYKRKRLDDLQGIVDRAFEKLTRDMENQRKQAEETWAEAVAIKNRDGIVDTDPDRANLDELSSRNPYFEAKTRALESKQLYEATRIKYWTAINERGGGFDPAKIWEKAEPPIRPIGFCFRRITHALSR